MTVTIKLKPEVEAGLLAQAQASGLNLEEYLVALAEAAAGCTCSDDSFKRLNREQAVRHMLEFGDNYRLSLGERVTRKILHEGHRW